MSLSSKQLLDKNENDWSWAGPKWPFLQTRYESSSRGIEIIRGWTFFDEDSFGSYVLDVKGIVICLTTLQIYMQFIKKYLTMFLFHSPRYALSAMYQQWVLSKMKVIFVQGNISSAYTRSIFHWYRNKLESFDMEILKQIPSVYDALSVLKPLAP